MVGFEKLREAVKNATLSNKANGSKQSKAKSKAECKMLMSSVV